MKNILIFLLGVIILILLYGQYANYQRFKLENYEYKMAKGIDKGYHDKSFLFDYYEAVEDLNTYVKAQWSANGIDVRVPEDDDEENKAAAKVYSKKLAKVKYYEDQLLLSAKLKKSGMSNADVKSFQEDGVTLADKMNADRKNKILTMFGNVSGTVKLGDESALVYEVQKLLKLKLKEEVVVDGVFKDFTANAIRSFEEENNLYPDGKLDIFTLEKLLE